MKLASVFLIALVMLASDLSAQFNSSPNDLKKKLSGTFWSVPENWPGRAWYCLNADGTATAGWHDRAGWWKVVGNLTIQISITGGETARGLNHLLHFNPELTQAEGDKRIDTPTQAMLDKVARGFTAATPNNSPSPTPSAAGSATAQTKEEAISILTTGQWLMKFQGWSRILKFNRNGTTVLLKPSQNKAPTWKLTDNTVVVAYPDGEHDKLFLPLDPKGTKGSDKVGNPCKATQLSGGNGTEPSSSPGDESNYFGKTGSGSTPAPAPPITPELQQSASDIVKANHNNLVFVTGKDGSGSGFIASLSGTSYLVTNAHVAAGISGASFKTLSGTAVRGGTASVAVGEDIFRMEMPAGSKPLEAMQGVDENAGIGDDVVVLGNAEGEGVINTIAGKIVGIGPNLVEINAPFVPGNSGSPIIHIKTGKVIGVATYYITQKYDATTKEKMKAPVIRRFGYRIDSVKTWQPVNWQTFYAQAAEMKGIESFTEDLGEFFRDLAENNGVVTPGRHTNPIIRNRIDQWLADKAHHLSPSDAAAKNMSFLSFLKISCQADVANAQRRMSYDYFQRQLATEQTTRNEMSKGFEEIIKSNRQ